MINPGTMGRFIILHDEAKTQKTEAEEEQELWALGRSCAGDWLSG